VFAEVMKNFTGEKKKTYYEKNKDTLNKRSEKYREQNKEKIKEYREKTIDKINAKDQCFCGGKFTYNGRSQHMRTNKHINYINSIEYLKDIHEYVKSVVKKFPTTI
jgi:hypothetical protein